jgi:chromosome segregation ATPase
MLTEEVKKLRENIEKQAVARHQANNELNKTIGTFSMQALRQEDRIDSIEASFHQLKASIEPLVELAKDLRDLKVRLIGDADLKSEGLVQEHIEVTKRLDQVEKTAGENRDSLRYLKWERRVVISVIMGVAAVVTFLKNSNFLQWLTKP